jgi:hypothetical protein
MVHSKQEKCDGRNEIYTSLKPCTDAESSGGSLEFYIIVMLF